MPRFLSVLLPLLLPMLINAASSTLVIQYFGSTDGTCTGAALGDQQGATGYSLTAPVGGCNAYSSFVPNLPAPWAQNALFGKFTCEPAGTKVKLHVKTSCDSKCATCAADFSTTLYSVNDCINTPKGSDFKIKTGTTSDVCGVATSYSSGYGSGNSAVKSAPGIVQSTKFAISKTQFDVPKNKNMLIKGYALSVNILKTDQKTFRDGCSCTATAARRSSITVTFRTTVPTTLAAATKNLAAALTPTKIAGGMQAAMAADQTLNGALLPVASDVGKPSGGLVSGCSTAATMGMTALALALFASRQ